MNSSITKWASAITAGLILCGLALAIWFYAFALPSTKGPIWGWHSATGTNLYELQERVKKADEYALRGSQQMATDSYFRAAFYYFRSLVKLPHAPITRQRKAAYQKSLRNSIQRIFP